MLTGCTARRGTTLVELLVALAIGGVVLGMVTSIGVRQQRLYGEIGRRTTAREHLRHAGAILPIDLRAASALDGDIIAGEARDTSLELRATLGSSIVCGASGTTLALVAPAADSDLASFVDEPREADTLWVLDDLESIERWRTFPVTRAWSSSGRCDATRGGPRGATPSSVPRLLVETGIPDAVQIPAGAPVRLTRRVRYSFYRASDGHWYLGYRDWNAGTGRLNQIQPVSGPFLSTAAGVGFRYFDSTGAAIPDGALTTAGIARIDILLRASGMPTLGRAGAIGTVDSSLIAVALRNRR